MFNKTKQEVDNVPILQQADLPAQQHGLTNRMSRTIASEIKCLFTTKPETLYITVPDDIPVWVKRYQQNTQKCPFYQLPAELLHLVIKNSDHPTRQIMRQTCKIFLEYIADMDIWRFESEHRQGIDKVPSYKRISLEDSRIWNRLVWPRHGSAWERKAFEMDTVGALLARDRGKQCGSCRAHHESGHVKKTLERLKQPGWGSGCGDLHPLLFFSATQRNVWPSQRICIGREGKVRLCLHESITWEEINERATTPGKDDSNDGFETVLATLRSCTHKSHQSPEAFVWEHLISPKIKILTPKPGGTYTSWGTSIHMTWISPMFDLDPNVPVKKQNIRDHLASRKHVFGHVPCPHVTLDDRQLLMPFEPNQCVCFEDAEAVDPPPYLPRSHSCSGPSRCCRCIAAKEEPHRRGHFMLTQVEEGVAPTTGGEKHQLREYITACHEHKCAECTAGYSWVRDGNCLVFLKFLCVFSLGTSPTAKSWLRMVDPESWGISGDEQLRHVVWCPVEGCATRSRWSQLLEVLLPGASWC